MPGRAPLPQPPPAGASPGHRPGWGSSAAEGPPECAHVSAPSDSAAVSSHAGRPSLRTRVRGSVRIPQGLIVGSRERWPLSVVVRNVGPGAWFRPSLPSPPQHTARHRSSLGSMCVEAENRAWPCGGGWSADRSRQDVCPGPSLLAEWTACQAGHPAFPRPLGPDLSAFASAPASQPLLWLFLCLKCLSPRRPGPTPSLHSAGAGGCIQTCLAPGLGV